MFKQAPCRHSGISLIKYKWKQPAKTKLFFWYVKWISRSVYIPDLSNTSDRRYINFPRCSFCVDEKQRLWSDNADEYTGLDFSRLQNGIYLSINSRTRIGLLAIKPYFVQVKETNMWLLLCLMEASSVSIHQNLWQIFKLKSNKLSAASEVENHRKSTMEKATVCVLRKVLPNGSLRKCAGCPWSSLLVHEIKDFR